MKPNHCACGRPYDLSHARFFRDPDGYFSGWYWDCACGSTHFKPEKVAS